MRQVYLFALCVLSGFLMSAAEATATEYQIVIHHLELEPIPEKAKVGDTLTFSNEAEMAHNIYIVYANGSVDNLDTQIPGVKRSLKLKFAGPATIRCWIHPVIKRELLIIPAGAEPKE